MIPPRLAPLLQQFDFARADHTVGSHKLTQADYPVRGEVKESAAAFNVAAVEWRKALLRVDDAGLDIVGYRTYPLGSDPENRFIDIVWWVDQELLHPRAEISLLRGLYRARQDYQPEPRQAGVASPKLPGYRISVAKMVLYPQCCIHD